MGLATELRRVTGVTYAPWTTAGVTTSRARGTIASSPTDVELMVRAGDGDERAFAVVYDRYVDRVYGLVRRILRDPAHAEEVTQEVLIEAWRLAARYDPNKGAVASWLLTLAHRRAVDRVRSEQAAREREEAAGTAVPPSNPDPVAEQVETSEEHDSVRDALGKLTELQREAIELAYFGGKTYREVAEELDAPLGTVKSRMRDGLLRLREVLEVQS